MQPKNIILHCSDSPDNQDITVKEIDEWHRARGFDKIGYHYVITKNGTVQLGRLENEMGAHCKGHNDSIGICWAGRHFLNDLQAKAMLDLIIILLRKYGWNFEKVYGHYEFEPKKTCPNLPMDLMREMIKRLD